MKDYLTGTPLGSTFQYCLQQWRIYTEIFLEQCVGLENPHTLGYDGMVVTNDLLVILVR